MRSRGFSCLVLGIWLAGGVWLDFVATMSSHAADRVFREANPGAMLRVQKLGLEDSRMLLQYEAADQTRFYFSVWENLQLAIALLFFLYLLFGTGENKIVLGCALGLLVVVLLQRFAVAPEIAGLGKLLDFVPEGTPSPHRGRFAVMQNTYLGMEIFKWILQTGMAAYFIGRTRRSRDSRHKLNVVNKADYGHIDR